MIALKIHAKFDRKITCAFKNDTRNFANFQHSTFKSLKLGFPWDPFIQIRKFMSLKFTGELCVVTMKNDTKFEEEFTCQLKTAMRYLTNFDPITRKSLKKSIEELCLIALKIDVKFDKKLTCVF